LLISLAVGVLMVITRVIYRRLESALNRKSLSKGKHIILNTSKSIYDSFHWTRSLMILCGSYLQICIGGFLNFHQLWPPSVLNAISLTINFMMLGGFVIVMVKLGLKSRELNRASTVPDVG
jgi:hypothetical protein